MLVDVAADIKIRKYDLKEPATVPGIITRGDSLEVIGSFDFCEVFQFEKRRFVRLSEAHGGPLIALS